MTNNGKKIDNACQLKLFDIVKQQQKSSGNNGGGLNIMSEFKQLISRCISLSKDSRYQIAAKMSELLGVEITFNMLNAWTAESHYQNRFPAEFLPAFCQVVKCYEPISFLAEKIGLFLLPGEEALRSEIQKIDEQVKELQKEKEKRVYFLSEIEKKGD